MDGWTDSWAKIFRLAAVAQTDPLVPQRQNAFVKRAKKKTMTNFIT